MGIKEVGWWDQGMGVYGGQEMGCWGSRGG